MSKELNDLQKLIDEVDYDRLFSIDETNIIEAYSRQAALYARFAMLQAQADALMSMASTKKDEEYAAADDHYRHDMDQSGEKYTEAKVRAFVELDETYRNAVDEYIETDRVNRSMKALVRAMEMRADMLVSMGAHLRHEMDMTNMRIKESKYDDAIGEAKALRLDPGKSVETTLKTRMKKIRGDDSLVF